MELSEKAKLIKLVKIGQRQLEMEDDSYRQMLKRLTNKNSATKCTLVELHKVIYELQQKGAKIKWFAKKSIKPTAYSPVTGEQSVKSDIAHKIRAIWIKMGNEGFLADCSERGLNKFIQAVLNRGRQKQGKTLLLAYVHTLNQRQATQIVEALKSWHKREMSKMLHTMGYVLPKESSYDAAVELFKRYHQVAK